jgi:hypothetical protein
LSDGNPAYSLTSWDPNDDHVWTIATASGGITGFAADKFTVNSSSFARYNSMSATAPSAFRLAAIIFN